MEETTAQLARDLAAAFPQADPVETLAGAIDSEIRGALGMAAGFRAAAERLAAQGGGHE